MQQLGEAAASDLAGGTVPAHDTDRIRPGEYRVDGGPTRRVGRVGGEIRARVDELRGVGGPVAQSVVPEVGVVRMYRVAPGQLHADHDVAFVVSARDAEQRRRTRLRALAVLHRTRLNVEVETLEVLSHDEVDDAGDRVGAIH